jgi:hypothetical protein
MSEAVLSRRGSPITVSGGLSLLAVVAVLFVVSVPRLRELAVQENEADARGTAQLLASVLRSMETGLPRKPLLQQLLQQPELRALADAEVLAGGTLLRRHGYLFEVTTLPPSVTLACSPSSILCGEADALAGQLAIRAWPWEHGVTGVASFVAMRKGGELAHPDGEASWSGLGSAGAILTSPEGWGRGGG